jgi:catechol-2,3-dioxygenase
MSTDLKAVVFKTTKLVETKHYFESVIGIKLKENSAKHFVLHSKGIRVVFIETDDTFGIELFIDKKIEMSGFHKEPNDFSVKLKI